ncbi:MAG: 3'(2'),5'-bisphosphate nucleotidase CysQ [Gammaproteobacteria bacterium]|nr:3'(2'),5'-bisphosphate nucleotidase CysQ [Gammaproteobacteria bacterium]
MLADLDNLLDPVVAIARSAGRAILEVYESEFEVETKADHSPLTAADRAAHELILRELGHLTPEIPVWSEESAAIPYEERCQWSRFWLVDPLDGTREFIKRNGEFTVNIALIERHEPMLGVVHVPVQATDYSAARGVGAFRERDGTRHAIKVNGRARDPVRVVGSRSHRGASLESFLHQLGPHEMVPMGSSLKICLVASGDADIYPRLGPTSEWDTAAAQAVVECAGGYVVDLDGQPLQYNTKADVLNPFFLVYGDPNRDWVAYTR